MCTSHVTSYMFYIEGDVPLWHWRRWGIFYNVRHLSILWPSVWWQLKVGRCPILQIWTCMSPTIVDLCFSFVPGKYFRDLTVVEAIVDIIIQEISMKTYLFLLMCYVIDQYSDVCLYHQNEIFVLLTECLIHVHELKDICDMSFVTDRHVQHRRGAYSCKFERNFSGNHVWSVFIDIEYLTLSVIDSRIIVFMFGGVFLNSDRGVGPGGESDLNSSITRVKMTLLCDISPDPCWPKILSCWNSPWTREVVWLLRGVQFLRPICDIGIKKWRKRWSVFPPPPRWPCLYL